MRDFVLPGSTPGQSTISTLIDAQTERGGDAPAIIGAGGKKLSYASLKHQLYTIMEALNATGIGRGDRVAVVLPNGPEMAVTFLGVAACATCAPLNPDFHEGEFEFYLKDIQAKALLILKDDPTPARGVAGGLGIGLIEIEPTHDATGFFTIHTDGAQRAGSTGMARPDDIGLILHTSGTTSRPKMVPLTQTNLCASAHNVAASLKLSGKDRCLNIMPLFHIHGLVAALLATLGSSGSVIYTPGFSEVRFFEWMGSLHPTWYTAVPTMHQAILARVENEGGMIQGHPLRFIRSSSSALPPQVMERLEKCFHAPVIEAYGMTEAAHQMSSNPLPPGIRKPRSVGMAAGPEVAVMGEDGAFLKPGQTGEIVIQGINVTAGYENNPRANQGAFSNGWFRTGDQGKFDNDGYLFITGRIKELINRGGEKVSPREVDEVMMDHPAVAQAVAFAVPHPTLGEDLAVAVVPREGYAPDETELRNFAALRLANFKVPTRIVTVDEIPKGPTGKPRRIGLADRMAKELAVPFEAPVSESERVVAEIFKEVIGCRGVGRKDNFFALGGDSLRAMRAHSKLAEVFGIEVGPAMLFKWPSVDLITEELERLKGARRIESILDQLEKLPEEEALRILEKGGSGGE